jgi:two-component system response regulator (stage 0 sporulation protein F)
MTIKKILVVEDDEDARWGLCHFLRKEGYDVREAEDGVIAYALLKKEGFDVILSDLKMPGMDGMELLKHCKKENNTAVFVMVTAFGDCESFWEILNHGAYEYLNKPVSLDEVLALLKKIEGEKA